MKLYNTVSGLPHWTQDSLDSIEKPTCHKQYTMHTHCAVEHTGAHDTATHTALRETTTASQPERFAPKKPLAVKHTQQRCLR